VSAPLPRTAPAFTGPPEGARSIDELLAGARARLHRLGPHETHRAVGLGAVLVDIRPAAQRAEHGEIPGALIIERNVLEWRLDPASAARLPQASYGRPLIVMCSAGYASSLAAESFKTHGYIPVAPAERGRIDGLANARAGALDFKVQFDATKNSRFFIGAADQILIPDRPRVGFHTATDLCEVRVHQIGNNDADQVRLLRH